jgi:hypothetical protein
MRPQIPEGASVKVSHLRAVILPDSNIPEGYISHHVMAKTMGLKIAAKGGRTSARIALADGRVAFGVAKCSDKDTFCKRIGRDIAVGRALKELRV